MQISYGECYTIEKGVCKEVKMKRKITCLVAILLVCFFIAVVIKKTDSWNIFMQFVKEYSRYINSDIEHKAQLFESIISGISGAVVTFGALFITIQHENKKDRIFWEKEREKDREERCLAVRPFLNVEIKSISGIRTGKFDEEKDFVLVGQGNKYQHAKILLSNQGYGTCKRIMIDGRNCSITQLEKEQGEEIDIYFKGIEDNNSQFELFFSYFDIFGHTYLQQFDCCLQSDKKNLEMEIREPLLT